MVLETQKAVELIAQAAVDKLAENVVAFEVSERLAITDYFVIASAPNERQVNAIVDGIEKAMLEYGQRPHRREGKAEGRWVLLDYGDIIVHVQHQEEREFYALDKLWQDCPQLELNLR
ncbi:MAG: ribosome silencing factor [Micrococcaceae bacterium]